MKPISAIIVHTNSSRKLEQLLSNHLEITIVEKTHKLEKTFSLIAKRNPDICFIDIESLNAEERTMLLSALQNKFQFPELVLITNSSENYRDVIDSEGITIMEKPITHGRVNQVIKQFHIDRTRNELKLLFNSCPFSTLNSEKIMIPVITGLKNIVVNEILYIVKDTINANNVRIYFDSEDIETVSGYLTLKQIKKALSRHSFFQIDRNTLINLNYLREIETKNKRCIVSKNGKATELPVSKNRLKEFREYCHSLLVE